MILQCQFTFFLVASVFFSLRGSEMGQRNHISKDVPLPVAALSNQAREEPSKLTLSPLLPAPAPYPASCSWAALGTQSNWAQLCPEPPGGHTKVCDQGKQQCDKAGSDSHQRKARQDEGRSQQRREIPRRPAEAGITRAFSRLRLGWGPGAVHKGQ